jgi:hypothetical protein
LEILFLSPKTVYKSGSTLVWTESILWSFGGYNIRRKSGRLRYSIRYWQRDRIIDSHADVDGYIYCYADNDAHKSADLHSGVSPTSTLIGSPTVTSTAVPTGGGLNASTTTTEISAH